MIKLILDFYLN